MIDQIITCCFCEINPVSDAVGVGSVCDDCTIAAYANTARYSEYESLRVMACSELRQRGIFVIDVLYYEDASTDPEAHDWRGGFEMFVGTIGDFMQQYGLNILDRPLRGGEIERNNRRMSWGIR